MSATSRYVNDFIRSLPFECAVVNVKISKRFFYINGLKLCLLCCCQYCLVQSSFVYDTKLGGNKCIAPTLKGDIFVATLHFKFYFRVGGVVKASAYNECRMLPGFLSIYQIWTQILIASVITFTASKLKHFWQRHWMKQKPRPLRLFP